MKYNSDTGMEPHLQEAVQDLLHHLNLNLRGNPSVRHTYIAKLNGIATALHALTGECWTIRIKECEATFVNEEGDECITAD